MDPITQQIVEALKTSDEPSDKILIRIFETGEGNASDIKFYGQKIQSLEGQMKRIISAQMATETLQPAKTFDSIRERLQRHSWAILGTAIVAVLAFGLHFFDVSSNLGK